MKTLQALLQIPEIADKIDPSKWNDQQLEVYINEFLPNSGLQYHFDHRTTYDEVICGITLNSNSAMSFVKGRDNQHLVEVLTPRKSLYVMYGEWRHKWKHGIQPKHITDRRVSITFRTVS